MASRSEKIEELLWDLDDFYPEDELVEEAWEVFEEEGDLPSSMVKKLKRMLKKAAGKDAA